MIRCDASTRVSGVVLACPTPFSPSAGPSWCVLEGRRRTEDEMVSGRGE